MDAFVTAKPNSFMNMLEPLHRLLHVCTNLPVALSERVAFFPTCMERLSHPKAVVRLNLLRILRIVYEAHPHKDQLDSRFGLTSFIAKLAESDKAVLVRELAKDLLQAKNSLRRKSSDVQLSKAPRIHQNNVLPNMDGRLRSPPKRYVLR